MINDGTSTIYGLFCLALIVLWVWNLILGIQVMRKLKEDLKWLEKVKDDIRESIKREK